MTEYKRILHPTDLSSNSNNALKHACYFAELLNGELHLLNVVNRTPVVIPAPDAPVAINFFDDVRRHADESLSELELPRLDPGIKVIRSIREGLPFAEIIEYANDNEMDMIVMGTHGHTGLMHLLIGSVAENVVRKAACPVLTVHPGEETGAS